MEISNYSNSDAARISGFLLFAYAVMLFFAAPILGGLSDRFGRRPVLLLALAGFSLNYFVMAAAPNLTWLFIARILTGIFGATSPAASACLVDISTTKQRAQYFGYAGAAFGLGFVFGPALGGLLGEYWTRLPFIVSGVFMLATFMYGSVAFKETLVRENRRDFDLKRANPLGNLISIARHKQLLFLLVPLFLFQLANQSYISIWAFFTIEVADWTPMKIGFSVGIYGAMLVLVQGFLTGPVVNKIGEFWCAGLGLLIGVLTYVGLAFSDGAQLIYLWLVIGGFMGFVVPSMQALMTKGVPADAQGELQGAIANSFSASTIIGPLAMSQLFWYYTNESSTYFPGAAFIAAALLIAFSLLIFAYGWLRKETIGRA